MKLGINSMSIIGALGFHRDPVYAAPPFWTNAIRPHSCPLKSIGDVKADAQRRRCRCLECRDSSREDERSRRHREDIGIVFGSARLGIYRVSWIARTDVEYLMTPTTHGNADDSSRETSSRVRMT